MFPDFHLLGLRWKPIAALLLVRKEKKKNSSSWQLSRKLRLKQSAASESIVGVASQGCFLDALKKDSLKVDEE
jgi:hypothetical protein